MAHDHRRLAAIVSADVVAYSRLMERDESGTLAALKAHRRELIDPKIAVHDGRIVKTTGDGLLLEFSSVVNAVRFAVDFQRGMAERNAAVPDERRIRFRVGINVGDIIIDDDDIFGDGVNVAARLQMLADPDGICVSRAVRDQVLDKLAFRFEALGEQRVKNIARPIEAYCIRDETRRDAVRPTPPAAARFPGFPTRASRHWWAVAVLAIALAGAAAWQPWNRERTTAPPALSIGVLPFAANGEGPGDARLASALTQDLTAALARWRWATVASGRPSGEPGKEVDARAAGQSLNVRYVVNGGVRRSGDKIAITVHLVEAASRTTIWSEQLESNLNGHGEEAAPALRLARRVRKALYAAEMRRAVAHPVPGSAWDLVLRGDAASLARNDPVGDAQAARKLYEQALRVDPNFVPALISIPLTYFALVRDELGPDRSRFRPQLDEADKLTSRAISIDPADASAWFMRSSVLQDLGRLDEALAAAAKAEALDPFNALYAANRAACLLGLDQPEEALATAEQALRLEPGVSGGDDMPVVLVCASSMLLGRYAEAIKACERAAALRDSWHDQIWLIAGYAQKADLSRATLAKNELLKQHPRFTIAKFRAQEASTATEGYLRRLDAHVLGALRKVGVPDQ